MKKAILRHEAAS